MLKKNNISDLIDKNYNLIFIYKSKIFSNRFTKNFENNFLNISKLQKTRFNHCLGY